MRREGRKVKGGGEANSQRRVGERGEAVQTAKRGRDQRVKRWSTLTEGKATSKLLERAAICSSNTSCLFCFSHSAIPCTNTITSGDDRVAYLGESQVHVYPQGFFWRFEKSRVHTLMDFNHLIVFWEEEEQRSKAMRMTLFGTRKIG